MARMIKLHHYMSAKDIWLNADAIISVVGDVAEEGTSVYTYAYAGNANKYRVAETAETVVEMIKWACNPLNPLDSYICVAPESINWAEEKRKEI